MNRYQVGAICKRCMGAVLILGLFALVVACASVGSPESRIINGANTVTATTALATVLLRNDRINVTQAKSYRAILGTAAGHLDTANADLLACRAKTGSTAKTVPDPCEPSVADDIALGLSVVGDVKKTLDAKK